MLKSSSASISGPELDHKAQEAILALVSTIPGSRAEIIHQPGGKDWDFGVLLQGANRRHLLICEVKSRAWPNELHAIAHRLHHVERSNPHENSTLVLIAPYFSPQAIDSCLQLGLSWVDLAGNGELRIDGAYIKVFGNPNPFKKGRGTASLYSPQSSQVVHALLLEPRRKWTTEELARTARVSLGQVSSVKRLLEANDWLHATYGETTLSEPKKLLDDWSLHYKPRRKTIRLFSLSTPTQLEEKIGSVLTDYAFTELSAAQRYAPYTRHQRVAFYVPRWRDQDASILGLRGGDGAANVTIYETGDEIGFTEAINGSQCASPIQTYLDLKLIAGRGQDAAEHLLETVIEARWK